MTKEQARTTAEALQAFADGKPGLYEGSQNGTYWMNALCLFQSGLIGSYFYYRFTPEKTDAEKRVEANAKLKAEWDVQPFPMEHRYHTSNGWSNWWTTPDPKCACFENPDFEFRRKPEPAVEPWTFESAPGWVKVRRKSDGKLFMAACLPYGVIPYNNNISDRTISYLECCNQFEQLTGEPCGTVKEGAE